jgi:hypothetical protein
MATDPVSTEVNITTTDKNVTNFPSLFPPIRGEAMNTQSGGSVSTMGVSPDNVLNTTLSNLSEGEIVHFLSGLQGRGHPKGKSSRGSKTQGVHGKKGKTKGKKNPPKNKSKSSSKAGKKSPKSKAKKTTGKLKKKR